MSKRSLQVLALLALAAAVAVAVVLLVGRPGESPVRPPEPTPEEEQPAEVTRLHGPPPAERPALAGPRLEEPVTVLLLVGAPQTFNAFLAQQWGGLAGVRILSWTAPPPPSPGTGPPPGDVLPGALARAPRSSLLQDEGVGLVALHDFDPRELEDEFWALVAERLAEGRLGLFVAPGMIHRLAALEHPLVGPLLPVRTVRPIAGQPAPGVHGALAFFELTAEGALHPASRLVPWPRWSRAIWAGTRGIPTPWGTRFCWPVDEVAPGAEVLLRTSPPSGEGFPALVATAAAAPARALFFGAPGLGETAAYGRASVVADWGVLLAWWLAWLTGRA